MRYLSIIILALVANIAYAQQVNPVTDYTFANRMSSGRSTVTDTAAYFSIGPRYGAVRGMMPPMVTDTVAMSANKRNGLLIFSIQKNKYQVWDSAGAKWADITGAAGSAIISADTAAMLLPYLRKADTTAMLLPYLRGSGTANYLPIFDATRSVINSKVYQTGNHLMFNTTTPSVSAAEYGTMDVNGSENAAYILKVGDAEKSYILSNGTDLTISNNPAGDLIFRNNNATRGRFTSAGQFRVNNLASPSIRLVTADTDGNLAGTVSVTQFIDTTEISTRSWVQRGDDSLGAVIATKVNISDTSSMLSPYLRKADTTAMLTPYARTSNVNASLATKLNISDTATMLAPYLKESDTAFLSNRINLKVNISDTATMLSPYLKESDTTFLSNRINLKVNISDTSSMLTNYIRHAGNGLTKSGQALSVDTAAMATRARVQKGIDSVATLATAGVTSVATGYGLSGGTITTTGTIIADSNFVASRLRVGKVVDSLGAVKQNVLTNPVTGTGTTNYVPKFTGTSTIGNSIIRENGMKIGINRNPVLTLDVQDTGVAYIRLISGNSTNQGASLLIQNVVNGGTTAAFGDKASLVGGTPNQTVSVFTGFSPSSVAIPLTFDIAATERARFNGAGELLLNTTTDAGDYKLQVSGNAYVTASTLLAATSGNVGIGLVAAGQSGFKTLELGGSGVSGLIDLYQGTSRQLRIYNSSTDSYLANVTNGGGMLFRTTTSGGTQNDNIAITSAGNIGMGTTSPSASAQLDVTSTTRGFLPPRMTTTQRDAISSPAAGLVIYNTTTSKLQVYTTAWADLH